MSENTKDVSNSLEFNYIYNQESERYAFYQIPKVLFTDERFKKLSCQAKILYGLMLDRVSLSKRNNWIDEQGRVYIYYTVEDAMEGLGCSKPTAIKSFKELEKEIRLIEKIRQGLGKPTIIYVKDFSSVKTIDNEEKTLGNPCISTEVKNFDFKKSNNFTSRGKENRSLEVNNFDPNNTNINNTDNSNTKSIYQSGSLEKFNNIGNFDNDGVIDKINVKDSNFTVYDNQLMLFKEQIEYDTLADRYLWTNNRSNVNILNGIVNIVADFLTFRKTELNIGGVTYPFGAIAGRFSQLNMYHIDYVIESFSNYDKPISNKRNFILMSLYNSIDTIDIHTTNWVNSSIYGRGQADKK